jgi:SAM-dependent methyltransferase
MTSVVEAFFALHDGLPRQAPGSDATTARLLALAAPAEKPRVLDLGCGPGRASLVLAAATGGHVTALDLHQPYLDQLTAEAARRGLSGRIDAVHGDMTDLGRFPDGGFDLVWAEGSAYIAGFDAALRAWRRLLTPGGALVVTELEWATATPSAGARAFWAGQYPLRDPAANAAAAQAAGYRVAAVLPLPDEDWFTEYYTPPRGAAAHRRHHRPGHAGGRGRHRRGDRRPARARRRLPLRRVRPQAHRRPTVVVHRHVIGSWEPSGRLRIMFGFVLGGLAVAWGVAVAFLDHPGAADSPRLRRFCTALLLTGGAVTATGAVAAGVGVL